MRKALAIILATALLGLISNPVWSAGTLKVTTPNGGQKWNTGSACTIKWNKGDGKGQVKIELLKSGRAYKGKTDLPKKITNSGKYVWKIPTSVPTGNKLYKIKITVINNGSLSDVSNRPFTITKVTKASKACAVFRVTTPNGGQKWFAGKNYTIKWNKGDGKGKVKIELLKSGKFYLKIYNNTKNDGTQPWVIPSSVRTGKAYKIKITSTTKKTTSDSSDKNFTISKTSASGGGRLRVTSLKSDWKSGDTMPIRWKRGDGGSFVKLQLLLKGKDALMIARKTRNDGNHPWKIPSNLVTSGRYQIKVESFTDSGNFGTGASFRISSKTASVATITSVSNPYSRVQWSMGETYNIRWSAGYKPKGRVKIQLYRSGKFYKTITGSTDRNKGSYRWTIPTSLSAGSKYQVRVQSTSNRTDFASSNGTFSISKGGGSIEVTEPNRFEGGMKYSIGDPMIVTWKTGNIGGKVQISLYRSGKFYELITRTENDGYYRWKKISSFIEGGSKYKVRVESMKDPSNWDEGDDYFSIIAAQDKIVVTWPNGGESLNANTEHWIEWDAGSGTGNKDCLVAIELHKGGDHYKTLHPDQSNNGKMHWMVSSYTDAGDDYKIRIGTPTSGLNKSRNCDESNYDFSDNNFLISNSTYDTPPSNVRVEVTGAMADNKKLKIWWDQPRPGGYGVRLFVYKGGSQVGSRFETSGGDGGNESADWSVNAEGKNWCGSSDFQIRVESEQDSSTYGMSDNFSFGC